MVFKTKSLSDKRVAKIKKDLDKREAILELMEQYTYPAIAKRHNTTPQIVERMDKGVTYVGVGEFED